MRKTKVFRKERKVIVAQSIDQDLFEELRQCRKELASIGKCGSIYYFFRCNIKRNGDEITDHS